MKTKICKKAGCGRAAIAGKDYCERHINNAAVLDRKIFTKRGKSSQWHSLYESPEWRRRRAAFLKKYPICFICGGKSTIVDHIIPHRGDLTLFWDENNWQPMCQRCHSRKTLKENNNFHPPRGDRGVKT
ncbi:MAG: HNH endonuclease [Treponema sp.]|nr:HNH endonuclease [Treponema sp.]